MTWHIYILRCGDGTLYTGITDDIAARVKKHATGKGAKYTKGRGPFALCHAETRRTKGLALKREREIKSMKREEKMRLFQK